MSNNIEFTSKEVVCEGNCAATMGSGDLSVFATPALVALMENAAMNAAALLLGEGDSTVGSEISVKHLKPSVIGAEIVATAKLTLQDGRRLVFEIEAMDGDDVVGTASHTRFVINREKFMAKAVAAK